MKNLTNLFSVAFIILALFLGSCATDEETIQPFDLDEALTSEDTNLNFEKLVLDNVSLDEKEGSVTIELTPEQFNSAINITFGTAVKDSQEYFENAEYRTVFRQNIQRVLSDNNITESSTGEKGFCDNTFFSEAYSNPNGYTSSSSNSLAISMRSGTSSLWASAFSCVTYEEAYSGYHSSCPASNCWVYAYYRASGGGANFVY